MRSKPTTRNRAANTATTATAPFQRWNTRKVLSSSIRATKKPTMAQTTMAAIMPAVPMPVMLAVSRPKHSPAQMATPYWNTGRIARTATTSPAVSKFRLR